METIDYYKHKPEIGVGMFRHVGYDDNEDFILADLLDDSMSFSVRKVDIKNKYEKMPGFDPKNLVRQTCGRREEDFRRQVPQNLDYWRYYADENKISRCSYCGSCNFEFFLEVIEAVNADKPGFGIERATGKNYKYYLRTPENPQVKFYVAHIPREEFEVERLAILNDKMARALRKSNEALNARFRIDS